MAKTKIDFYNFHNRLNKCYWDFFDDRNRIRLLYGSAGSGKSFYCFQEMIYRVANEPGQNFLVIRKVGNTHRASTYSLTKQILSELNMTKFFKENKSDMTFMCKHNGNMIIFKGCDDREKLKSVTATNGPITSILCEEATELSFEDVQQLNVRLRGQAKVPFQLTLLFNPISVNHWIYKHFFLNKTFQKNYPVTILKTTYLDNDFLDEDYRIVLESYKDIDEQFYRVYCLGEFGVYGNSIFNNYSLAMCPYKESDFDAIYTGMDFGYSHPQVIEKIGMKDGTMYSFNELCATEQTNKEFIDMIKEFNILQPNEHIVCDSAEPSKIKELVQYGFGATGAVKGKDSISRGIDFLKSQKWVIDPDRCPRLAQEVEQYHWKKDKEGNVTDKPVELFEDAIHACFYALESLSRSKGKPGVLSGTISDQKKELINARRLERQQYKEAIMKQRQKRKDEITKLEKKDK